MEVDCTTVYLPNGKAQQLTPLNKAALQKFGVEQWARFSAPMYDAELMLKDYHLIRDKGTAQYTIHKNRVTTDLGTKPQNKKLYSNMKDRKQLDTFY